MGWKTIKGRRYYYKSERDEGRVKTTCFGAGEIGPVDLANGGDRATEREDEFGINVGPSGRSIWRRRRPSRIGSMTSRPWPTRRWLRPGFTSTKANGGGNGNE